MWKEFLVALVLLPVIDAPWLWFQTAPSRTMFTKIQGGAPLAMRLWPALIVYIALAYLLLQQTSVLGAAINGSAVYAVYDFTNLVVFKDYTLSFALQDTVWGGVLFGASFLALDKIRRYM
jgi:uncharacterized membrane protein